MEQGSLMVYKVDRGLTEARPGWKGEKSETEMSIVTKARQPFWDLALDSHSVRFMVAVTELPWGLRNSWAEWEMEG